MKIKKLETTFSKLGFNFRQIKRTDNVAIFEKTKEGVSGEIVSFEVAVIRAHEGYEIAGNTVEPSEFMPRNEDWGTFGWSYTKEEDAHKKFGEVVKQEWTYLVAGPNTVQPAGKPRKRGRKPSGFTIDFPNGEFTMKQLGEHNSKTSAYVYTFMKQRGLFDQIKEVRQIKGGRGKPTKVYTKA